MARRLELYEWPRDYRTNAEEMYKVARKLLLEARSWRKKDRRSESYAKGRADAARASAALILGRIREGRDDNEFYRRKLYRECIEKNCLNKVPESLPGAMFDAMHVRAAGLDRPEFDEKAESRTP